MTECPDCDSKLQEYLEPENGFIQYICWRCGFYESNSPAYRANPEQFVNMIRDNPSIINRFLTDKKTTADYTDTL